MDKLDYRYNLIRFDTSTAGTSYKLFVRSLYDYVIVKEVTTSDVTERSYFVAAKGLETSWTNRASLTYSIDIRGRKLVNEGQNWLAAAGRTFTGLLDTYGGAAAAYSLQFLSSDYSGNCLTVRRASDNATLDVGFSNNELDTASLEAFCSGTDGYVTTWYDQSGNGLNATQTTAANQPQIVSSGSVLLKNGKPSINFGGTAYLETVDTTVDLSIEQIQMVAYNDLQITSTSGIQQLLKTYGVAGYEGFAFGSVTTLLTDETFTIYNNSSAREAITNTIDIDLHLFTTDWDGTKHNIYLDGSAGSYISTGTLVQLNGRQITIGSRSGSFNFVGSVSCFVAYSSNQSSNVTAIQDALNDYYSIY